MIAGRSGARIASPVYRSAAASARPPSVRTSAAAGSCARSAMSPTTLPVNPSAVHWLTAAGMDALAPKFGFFGGTPLRLRVAVVLVGCLAVPETAGAATVLDAQVSTAGATAVPCQRELRPGAAGVVTRP